MTKYSFILLSGEEKALLEQLQEIGLVDISRSTKPVDEHSREIVSEIELLDGILKGLQTVEIPEGTAAEAIEGDIVRIAGGTLVHYTQDTDAAAKIRKEIQALRAWGEFDPAVIDKLRSCGVPLHFHSLAKKAFKEQWKEEYALSVVNTSGSSVLFVVAGEDSLPGEIPAPEADFRTKEEELKAKEQEIAKDLGHIAEIKKHVAEIEELKAQAYSRLDLYLASLSAVSAAEDTIVTLVGYAPTEQDRTVSEALDATGAFYIKEVAKVQDNPPISFRNNKFVKMFEVLTDMYGRPAYDGFDPTPFIAIFFLLFFALCMGDAGYGLVLILIGLALKKVPSFKDMAPLVVTLGVGTVVIGFFMHSFFSIDISKWEVFAPVKGLFVPDEIAGYAGGMVLAIVVGIVHLCLAMLVKAIHEVRTRGFAHSLGTLGWTLLIVGGVVVGSLALAGVLDSAVTKWTVIAIGIISAIGIFPLNNLERNKLANVGLGLWDTYNTATGLLGDVLSYLRLYALGLAGSMLGMAFNDMGAMVLGDGSAASSWIFFILLVLVGHTLNIAMCALGAFVHPLRLNFLEFFKNSGYEAAGRNYNPLKKQSNK